MHACYMNLTEMLCAMFYVTWYKIGIWIGSEWSRGTRDSSAHPDVTFFCGYGYIPGERAWPDNMTRNCIGGSERCVIELAKQIVVDRSVVIYNSCVREDTVCDGILYKPSSTFNPFEPRSNVVFWRMPCLLSVCEVNANRTFLWIHDGPPIQALQWIWDTIGPWLVHRIVRFVHAHNASLVIFPSAHLHDMTVKAYPKCTVIPNGVVRYDDVVVDRRYEPGRRVKFIWTPPHDRGLVLILREFARLNIIFPGKLEFHVYNSHITSTSMDVSAEVTQLIEQLNSAEDIVYTYGFVSHRQLMAAYHATDFFVYPATVDESFSLCTHEALVAGCTVMTNSRGCFADIEKYGGHVYPTNDELFVGLDEKLTRFIRGGDVISPPSFPLTWGDVGSMWISQLKDETAPPSRIRPMD